MATKILLLDGLNDTKLCQLTEQMLLTLPGVSSANIDILSQRLILNIDSDHSADVVARVVNTLKRNMPDVTVKFTDVGAGQKAPAPVRDRRPEPVYRAPEPEEDYEDYGEDEDGGPEEEDGAEQFPGTEEPKRAHAPQLTESVIIRISEVGLAALIYFAARLPVHPGAQLFFLLTSYLLCVVALFFPQRERWFKKTGLSKAIMLVVTAAMLLNGWQQQAVALILIFHIGLMASTVLYDLFDSRVERVIDVHPAQVARTQDGVATMVPFDDIRVGDEIVVQPGAAIPFDGTVTDGLSKTMALLRLGTDEAGEVGTGVPVYCGDINLENPLTVLVAQLQDQSLIGHIRKLLTSRSMQDTLDSLSARKWTLIFSILGVAALLARVYAMEGVGRGAWIAPLASLCPCGLMVSLKAAQLAGLGQAAKKGVLVRGVESLEKLATVKTLVTGYTGVLTEGAYQVRSVHAAADVSWQQVLEIAAALESKSPHPIARAIVEEYQQSMKKEAPSLDVAMFEAIPGYGVRAMVDHQVTLIGNAQMMEDAGFEIPTRRADENLHLIYVAVRGGYIGHLELEDALLEGASGLGQALKGAGVEHSGILSTCDPYVLQDAKAVTGVDEIYAASSEPQKLNILLTLLDPAAQRGPVALASNIGDIQLFSNPCIRIMLGTAGLENTFFVADAVVTSADPVQIADTLKIARRTRLAAKFNLAVCLAGKTVLVGAALAGLAQLPVVVLCNAGLTVFLALNATWFLRR